MSHGANHDAFFFQYLPGRIVRVVIETREQNFITGLSSRPMARARPRVDGGHVLAENDFFRRAVEEIAHRRARDGNHFIGAAGW